MLRKSVFFVLLVAAISAFSDGCTTTETITRRSQLTDPVGTGTIRVLTNDKTLYELNNYILTDSLLIGVGSLQKNGERLQFRGQLRLSNIAYIQAQGSRFWKGVAATGLIVFFTTQALAALGGEGGSLNVKEGYYSPYSGGGGGSSCPFIYSWDGNRFVLEAEALGIGIGKALELTTCSVLPSLKEDHSQVRIRITNERPETHYFNSVQLEAAEIDCGATVIADSKNTLWPVYQALPPLTAVDQSGNNIIEKVHDRDRKYWESDLSQTSVLSDFQDVIDVSFVRSSSQKEGSLVLHVINTKFVNAVFKNTFQFMGDQSLAFMQAVEHDPELIATLKQWIVECSLKAFLWNGNDWEQIGVVYPEANITPFSRLIRFDTGNFKGDTVKIRLTSLADLWKIDAVQLDWTPVQPLKSRIAKMRSAVGPRGKDLSSTLQHSDNTYAVLFPPEQIELTFDSIHPSHGKKVVYALNVRGYLYEWFPEEKNQTPFTLVKQMSDDTKIPFFKNLLNHKSIFLPLMYSEWKKMKSDRTLSEQESLH